MPVKRRISKRRVTPEQEAAAWRDYFEAGFDFFGDAAEMCGLPEPVNVWPPEAREEARQRWKAAADAAWARVGHLIGGSEPCR
jgi:hypothetical protein